MTPIDTICAPDIRPIDVSALLKPGVFLLHHEGRVVYIGKAKVLLIALAHHALRNRDNLPPWFPVKPIAFDGVEIIPCDPVRAVTLQSALIALHDPLHNRPLKSDKTLDHGPPPAAVRRTSSLTQARRL